MLLWLKKNYGEPKGVIENTEWLETRKELGSIYYQDLTFVQFYRTVKIYWDRNIFLKINSVSNPVSTPGCKSIPEYTAAQTIITCICMCLTCRLSAWKAECHPAAEWVVYVCEQKTEEKFSLETLHCLFSLSQ